MEGNVDKDINKGGGPFIFRMSGQNYHLHGTVLPRDEEIPKFVQLYIVDMCNEISNRYAALSSKNEDSPKEVKEIDRSIAVKIKEILNSYNALVKDYRAIGEQIDSKNASTVNIRLISRKESDVDKNKEKLGKNYDLPTANEVAAIVVGDIDGSTHKRDIIVQAKNGVKLEEIPYMPCPDLTNKDDWTNILIQEELNINKELLVEEHMSLMSSMTNEQRDSLEAIISAIYPTIEKDMGKPGYFENKAILVPTNEEVDMINDNLIKQLNITEKTYLSTDTICETEIDANFDESIYSPELLNAYKISDLIGFLSGCYDIEDTEINGHPKMKLDCNIMDLNRNRLYCTLYGEHAWQLGKYVADDYNYNNISNVIIFQDARWKIWSDNISIHNGYHATRLFINSKLPEIEEFKHKFRLHARVADVSGGTTFIMFDREVSRLINMSAQQLLEIQKHIGDINTFPQVFGKFVGRKFSFKVEIFDYNIEGGRHAYNVLKMMDDHQVVPELHKIHAEDEDVGSVEEEQVENPVPVEEDDVEPTSLTGRSWFDVEKKINNNHTIQELANGHLKMIIILNCLCIFIT
ncbi:hypothetical protein CTI12_AA009110 [Artemisia annua]|uniref:Uncharacterized protein n=1 Tax=Artemisia annua TaxID=35608 RepID=A0A2U1QMY5_ARTAN|nr:hypothetical protein CTI12_AA009110 [Artemisia annua]